VVDGEEVIKPRNIFGEDRGSKNLSAGEHSFTFTYRKNFSWAPSGFGLYMGKANARPKALTTANSLPPVRPTPLITAEAEGNEPRVLRSFMVHDGKKKTHVISVGNPSGLNYAYDLKQGGLLKLWRADFLNVTEMWHERGEPQTASPMGSAISFSDRAVLAVVSNDKSPLPDSLDSKDLSYKGYALNDKQCPVFQYQYKNIVFEDLLQPSANGQGLSRKVSVNGINSGQLTYLRVAQGTVIEKVGDNIFAINNQEYFIQLPAGTKVKYELKESPGKQELVIPVTGTSSFEFILVW
jgi:hypothetical protein